MLKRNSLLSVWLTLLIGSLALGKEPSSARPAVARSEPVAPKVPANHLQLQLADEAVPEARLASDRLMLVFHPGAAGADLFGRSGQCFVHRALLAPMAEGKTARLARLARVKDTPVEAAVDGWFELAGGRMMVVRFSLAMGQPFAATEAREGVASLAVQAPSRYVVLPDFFADDLVIDPREIPLESAEIPSENFLLQMLDRQDAVLLSVSSSRDEDASICLSDRGSRRLIAESRIPYGKGGKIWVGLLEGPGIWHHREIAPRDAGKTLALDWRPPFAAQWRVDWRRDDRLTDSWEMITEKPGGEFLKLGWFGEPTTIPSDRRRWTTVLGWTEYPCWIDRQGRAYLEPLARKKVRFQGPAVIYPIYRAPSTTLDAFTVVDLIRATLGVGPCQYILDVEGQNQAMRGRATCANRDTLDPIYQAGTQKSRRAEIERSLEEVVVFVKHIRERIEEYAAFGRQTESWLAEQRKQHPELAGFFDEMDPLVRAIQENYDRRKEEIKTPQYVVDLTEKFRRELLDYEGPDALARCKQITAAIVKVGGNQDELVGESRMAVKVLRQRAALAMATNPRAAGIAKEIRRRTQEVLRNPASYEGARH